MRVQRELDLLTWAFLAIVCWFLIGLAAGYIVRGMVH